MKWLFQSLLKKSSQLWSQGFSFFNKFEKKDFFEKVFLPFVKKAFLFYAKVSILISYYTIMTKIGISLFVFSLIYGLGGFLDSREISPSHWVALYYLSFVLYFSFFIPLLATYPPIRDFLFEGLSREWVRDRIGNAMGSLTAGRIGAVATGYVLIEGSALIGNNWYHKNQINTKLSYYGTTIKQLQENYQLGRQVASAAPSPQTADKLYQRAINEFNTNLGALQSSHEARINAYHRAHLNRLTPSQHVARYFQGVQTGKNIDSVGGHIEGVAKSVSPGGIWSRITGGSGSGGGSGSNAFVDSPLNSSSGFADQILKGVIEKTEEDWDKIIELFYKKWIGSLERFFTRWKNNL